MKYTFENFIKELNKEYATKLLIMKDEYNEDNKYFDYKYFPEDNELWVDGICNFIKITDEYIELIIKSAFGDLVEAVSCLNDSKYYTDFGTHEIYIITKNDINNIEYIEWAQQIKCEYKNRLSSLMNKFDDIYSGKDLISDIFNFDKIKLDVCNFLEKNYTTYYNIINRDDEGYYIEITSCDLYNLTDKGNFYNYPLEYVKGGELAVIVR